MISHNEATEVKVINVCTSPAKGTAKRPVAEITLVPDFGIQGDAHAGKWHRQVSLLAQESHQVMLAKGANVTHGDFGENIVTQGINLVELPIGTRLKLGKSAVGRVTQIGKKCHAHCEIFHAVGECIMPKEGIFVEILEGGSLAQNDGIEIIEETV
ncbi:MAG: MOSC domain-containing protein [Desulfobulbaceae bacterium]|uniref:MOSC domain-containing protein n=1 Tax=Candidatus Desulfobia pelagia TaxID=2841692 RepID=A0A8J6N9Y8_9BACT|nr:MOSC domain-containing protein [Candidatus Desulfobia pelagia]